MATVVHKQPEQLQQLIAHRDALERLQSAVRIAIAVLEWQPGLTSESAAELDTLRRMTRGRVAPIVY